MSKPLMCYASCSPSTTHLSQHRGFCIHPITFKALFSPTCSNQSSFKLHYSVFLLLIWPTLFDSLGVRFSSESLSQELSAVTKATYCVISSIKNAPQPYTRPFLLLNQTVSFDSIQRYFSTLLCESFDQNLSTVIEFSYFRSSLDQRRFTGSESSFLRYSLDRGAHTASFETFVLLLSN